MRDELLQYYERELSFLRNMGRTFAEQYPNVATELHADETQIKDPHVERLMEGFAFLAARVHLKIDDDFPEITEALLNVLYPHYVRPIPAMSLVEVQLDPEQGKLMSGKPIARGEELYYSHPGKPAGVECRFRTCYDTTIWPIEVTRAEWLTLDALQPPVRAPGAAGAIRLQLQCFPDVTFEQLELETLRLYLHGEDTVVATLYELLDNSCTQVLFRDPDTADGRTIEVPSTLLEPVGFKPFEGMLPFPGRGFLGFRLLQEYFTFHQKFHFFDLSGFGRAREAGFGNRLDVVFILSPFERDDRRDALTTALDDGMFRLGCVPIVNLFQKTSEPIPITHRSYEYPIDPDARRRSTTGIFSVDRVTSIEPGARETKHYEPLYGFRHRPKAKDDLFWQSRRRMGVGEYARSADDRTEVYLSFVDLSATPRRPEADIVTTQLTCFNNDLPRRLPFGHSEGDFTLKEGGPIARIRTLVDPTKVIPPQLGKAQLWRLVSHLALNYHSLIEGGVEALQEMLGLYNLGGSLAEDRKIQGIVGLTTGPAYSRIVGEHGVSFARGHKVEIEFDEEQFAGSGVYLFASVLERFLGMYTSINSFSMVAARTRQRNEALRIWSPRAGTKALL